MAFTSFSARIRSNSSVSSAPHGAGKGRKKENTYKTIGARLKDASLLFTGVFFVYDEDFWYLSIFLIHKIFFFQASQSQKKQEIQNTHCAHCSKKQQLGGLRDADEIFDEKPGSSTCQKRFAEAVCKRRQNAGSFFQQVKRCSNRKSEAQKPAE